MLDRARLPFLLPDLPPLRDRDTTVVLSEDTWTDVCTYVQGFIDSRKLGRKSYLDPHDTAEVADDPEAQKMGKGGECGFAQFLGYNMLYEFLRHVVDFGIDKGYLGGDYKFPFPHRGETDLKTTKPHTNALIWPAKKSLAQCKANTLVLAFQLPEVRHYRMMGWLPFKLFLERHRLSKPGELPIVGTPMMRPSELYDMRFFEDENTDQAEEYMRARRMMGLV